MTSKLSIKYLDASNEKTTSGFYGTTFTSANFDSQVGLQDALISAIDGITLGTLNQYTRQAAIVDGSSTPPANQFAQREVKWRVVYADDVTGKEGEVEIGTADLALLVPGTELMDVSAGAGLAFVTAFENYQKGPETGNDVTFLRAEFVGRNL